MKLITLGIDIMTVQLQDQIEFQDQSFCVTTSSGSGLFNPRDYGMEPLSTATCCWAGWVCRYGVVDDALVLLALSINLESSLDESISLNGVRPTTYEAKIPLFTHIYDHINLKIPFSGGILAARKFLSHECNSAGSNPAWKFEHSRELVFDNGLLVQDRDVSEFMKEVRACENYVIPRLKWWKRLFKKGVQKISSPSVTTGYPLKFKYGGWYEDYEN